MTKKALIVFGAALAIVVSGKSVLAGDAAAGETVFKKKCKTCHTVEEGKHRTGPSLFGVFGRQAGATDFKRYKGLKEADYSWDEANLDEYIADPKAFVKKHGAKSTAMTFKLKDETERANVIEYLKTVK